MSGAALVGGYAADVLFGDPRRWHPVAGFGNVALAVERASYRPTRVRGALHAAGLVLAAGAVGELLARAAARGGAGRGAALAAVTWAALGGRSLAGEARRLATCIELGDLDGARAVLPSLCGRDPARLDEAQLCRAAVESVAENTSDAVVGALVWGAIGGPAGVAAYRAANTLDAMVGHRSERYADFGWAAARLDDAMNWPAARLTAALTVLCAPVVGGSARAAARIALADGAKHPSPNAGRAEAAFAGALGVRLGGPLKYGGVAELRPTLGAGRPPGSLDVHRAARLSWAVGASAAGLCAAARAARTRRACGRVGGRPVRGRRRRGRALVHLGAPDRPEGRAVNGAILVCGTHSDAGKSVVTAGVCRWLHRQGVSVAPFKAQNMALNSVVARDGSEIGRAQAVQAAAAGIEPEAAMNPILIKPSGERHSQVIVMGKPYADANARSYQALKNELRPVVARALADLRARFDVVVCEGAGSPAEINLRHADLTNMGLARDAGLPVLLVGDIDRGGVFASLFGTLALLDAADQAHVAGFVINKFRGDASILAPGLEQIAGLTGRPVLGVLPHVEDLWMDVEDSLALEAPRPEAAGDAETLDVVVLRLRWMSNFTDLDALEAEPAVRVRFSRSVADIERADLLVVPGTKATVEDLARLRGAGLDRAIVARAAAGAPILGICGGYQLLGQRIADEVESGQGEVAGLGVLPVVTTFERDKVLRRRAGRCAWLDTEVGGYEIRHGRVTRRGGDELLTADDGEPDGCRVGHAVGTSWHGALEHDAFRRALLRWVAAARGRRFEPGSGSFAAARERRLDVLGDLVADHVDTARLADLIEAGVPAGLPTVQTEVRPCCAS